MPQMLEDEVAWLSNFVPSEHHELKETDNSLLAGHLKLIKTLFTCDGVSKEEHGRSFQSLCTQLLLYAIYSLLSSADLKKSCFF